MSATGATIIDGKAVAARIRAEVAEEVGAARDGRRRRASRRCWSATTRPRRSTSAASTRPAPRSASRSIGHELPADTAEDELLDLVDELNADPAVSGIIVQLPLPDHLDAARVTSRHRPARRTSTG